MEKFVLLPHDKYQKLALGRQSVPHMANQLQNYKITAPPPGLPGSDRRALVGEEIDRKNVELKRDKKLEQEVGEISDTDSENSELENGTAKDWVSVWKHVK